MRIAWFSPMPPMASGIADYSFELLPYLAEGADVDVFCPNLGRRRSVRAPSGIKVRHPAELERRGTDYDAVFHHLGNNPFHEFVYRAALRRPGVAVMHELVLHHLVDHLLLGQGRLDFGGYARVMADEIGPQAGRLAHLRAIGASTELEMFLFPLSRHVLRASGSVIVHGQRTREQVLDLVPGVPVTVIPHHAGREPAEVRGVTRREARARLGLPTDAYLVGQFGFLTRPKQPAAVLGGFARLLERRPDARLLVVGENQLGVGVEAMLRVRGLTDVVRVTGYVDLVRFWLYLKAVDVVVNLRYPSAGEASGTFTRALAEGRVAIVSNLGSFAEYPDDICLKVEVDGNQAEQTAAHLLRLSEDPALAEHIERRAREFAHDALDPARCAGAYLDVARSVAGRATVPAG